MKSLGITRKIDEVGRIVLPKELRRMFDLTDNVDSLEIFVDEDSIVLKKYVPTCVFCSSAEDTMEFMGHKVCMNCIETMNRLQSISKDKE